jgi:MFS superfamily sulfate permease-like transporter
MLLAIAIPGQLATARLAGMPPQTGLYAFVAGSLAFAAFGANRFMSIAAESTIAPIFAGGLEHRSLDFFTLKRARARESKKTQHDVHVPTTDGRELRLTRYTETRCRAALTAR